MHLTYLILAYKDSERHLFAFNNEAGFTTADEQLTASGIFKSLNIIDSKFILHKMLAGLRFYRKKKTGIYTD